MRKWLMRRVFPGVPDTLASPVRAVSMLMSDDFPTLLRPMKAMSFRSSFGTCEMRSDEHLNSALVICIGIWFYTKVRKSRMAANLGCVRGCETFRLLKGSLRPQRYEKAGWLQNRIACGSVKPSGC